jgi:YD repeat-containing protein
VRVRRCSLILGLLLAACNGKGGDSDPSGDTDTDGVPSGRQYDGCVEVIFEDEGDDGTADRLWTWTWSETGLPVSHDLDYQHDGDVDVHSESVFRDDVAGYEDIFVQDSIHNLVWHDTHEYPLWGTTRREDAGPDGALTWSGTYTYDGPDLTTYFAMNESFGKGVEGRTYQYDSLGHVMTETYDWDGSGTIDETITYTWAGDRMASMDYGTSMRWTLDYDADGNLILIEQDYGIDGTADLVDTRTWEGGRLVKVEEADGAGTVVGVETYAYDAEGRMTEKVVDAPFDGTIDERNTITWTCP